MRIARLVLKFGIIYIPPQRIDLINETSFSKNNIQIPVTGFAISPRDTKDLINMVDGAPLIIKLLESTQGVGVVLAETNKAAESVINAFKSVQTKILVQEFIKEKEPYIGLLKESLDEWRNQNETPNIDNGGVSVNGLSNH